MSEARFDGRVAVITGAGQGLGRAHALLLASRGAKVVVNDLGGGPQGGGASQEPAQAVVDEIRAAGGEAVASFDSVATPEGGKAIVQVALDAFGKVDAILHNAGITGGRDTIDSQPSKLDAILDVHLKGAFHVIGAAWPHLRAQGYGRILNTISNAGVFGLAEATAYSAAKGGLAGLTRALANEGAECGIQVNALAPAAHTRLTNYADDSPLGEWWKRWFQPERVSPLAAWLLHEDCPVTGEFYSAGGGRAARIFVAETMGFWKDGLTVEDVRDQFDRIRDEEGYVLPKSSMDEMMLYHQKIG